VAAVRDLDTYWQSGAVDVHYTTRAGGPLRSSFAANSPADEEAIIPDAVSTPQVAAIVATARVRPAQSAGVGGFGG
jgi:hypothetical protein